MRPVADGRHDGFSAVVHAADGVLFVARGETREQVAIALAGYVRARCDDVLWPLAARDVRALIEARQWTVAVETYFNQVGDRWDEERLDFMHGSSLHPARFHARETAGAVGH